MFGLFASKARFEPEEEKQIIAAIKAVERHCTAEVHVHLSGKIRKGLKEDAIVVFKKLKLHKTTHRNGVLFYIVPSHRQFYILGDVGIYQKVEQQFWNELSATMQNRISDGGLVNGILSGIELAGAKLIEFFPATGKSNPNELKDEISRS